MSSTFKLREHDDVPVTLPEGLSEDMITAHHPFKNWLKTLTHSLSLQTANPAHPFHDSPYRLRAIAVQSFDLFGRSPHQRLGFLKLTATVTNDTGEELPGAVFLRGPSVAMFVVLTPDDDHPTATAGHDDDGSVEQHVLLTVQPRVAAGSLAFAELPAGMVDEEGAFVGTAAREIREELGLQISVYGLVCLTDLAGQAQKKQAQQQQQQQQQQQPPQSGSGAGGDEQLATAVYPSPGGCDEFVSIYLHERRVPRAQLGEWTGRLTGLRDEGEKIMLRLVPLRNLWREGARDAKCLAALALYEGLRREGKL